VYSSGNNVIGDNAGITDGQEQLHVRGNIALDNVSTINNLNKRNHQIYGIDNSRRVQLSTAPSTSNSSSFFQMFGDETCASCNTSRAGEFTMQGRYVNVVTNKTVGAFGTNEFKFTSTGDLRVPGDVFSNGTMISSDKNLKRDVQEFDLGLSEVLEMSPKKYFYNGKAGTNTSREHTGVIAQEFRKIVPNAVKSYVWENLEKTESEEFLAVDEGMIKFMLVNAIQEQQEMIQIQAEKIEALEEAIITIGSTDVNNNTNVTLSSYDLAELNQNNPNPFNGFTQIEYVVPSSASSASISIFGTSGQLMKILQIQHIGKGTLDVNASDLPSGTYAYTLVVDGKTVDTNKMVISK